MPTHAVITIQITGDVAIPYDPTVSCLTDEEVAVALVRERLGPGLLEDLAIEATNWKARNIIERRSHPAFAAWYIEGEELFYDDTLVATRLHSGYRRWVATERAPDADLVVGIACFLERQGTTTREVLPV